MDSIGTENQFQHFSVYATVHIVVTIMFPSIQISHRFLLIPVVLRLAFLPLFALCNVLPRSSDASVVFNSDIYPIVFMALMAISNGYLGTLSMMYGPKYGIHTCIAFVFNLSVSWCTVWF